VLPAAGVRSGGLRAGQRGIGLAPFRTAYQGYVVTALWNSMWVGLAASAAALAVAAGLAWLCERVRIPGARAWRLGVWLLLLIPTYLSALRYEDLLAPSGVIAQLTGWYPAALDHLLLGGQATPRRRPCGPLPGTGCGRPRAGALPPSSSPACSLSSR
jgi:ABC-type Fe3+ transport system permease subunit